MVSQRPHSSACDRGTRVEPWLTVVMGVLAMFLVRMAPYVLPDPKVGAFTFGGGLTILAFIQEQVVHHLHWLTPQQFLDGLALGQLTPGPTLILAAFVGYAVGTLWGAVVAVAAVYLPSFTLMLTVLPVLERLQRLAWMQAVLQGISPAVIGMTAVEVLRMLPAAISDLLTGVMAVSTVVAMGLWHLSPLPLITGGAAIGFLLHAKLR